MDKWAIFGALARHVLTAIGGYFVSRGVIDQGSAEAIVGGLMAGGAFAWSLNQKHRAAREQE